MDLGSAMSAAIAGGRPPADTVPPGGVPSRADLAAFQDIMGSQRASARAIGVSLSTWQRWLAGTRPRPITAGKFWRAVQAWRRRNALDPDRERRIRNRALKLTVRARGRFKTDRKGEKARMRTMDLGRHFPGALVDSIVDAWLAADDGQVAALVDQGIGRDYAPGLVVDQNDVEWARFA